MVKSVLGVNHQGLRDWLFQRLSAVVMAIYFIGLMIFFFTHTPLDYDTWHALFAQGWVKIATILVVLSLLYHTWVGMWTIFTDYVTCPAGRLVLHTIVFLALVSFFFIALMILWGV